jgi:hypothetical protein
MLERGEGHELALEMSEATLAPFVGQSLEQPQRAAGAALVSVLDHVEEGRAGLWT